MNQNEILNANLLDIVFDNRNKNYGAYTLRKFYPGRLTKSLSISIGLVIFLFAVILLSKRNELTDVHHLQTVVQLSDIQVPQPKPPELKQIVQPRTSTVPFTSRIILTSQTTMASQQQLVTANPGTTTVLGTFSDIVQTQQPIEKVDDKTNTQPAEQPTGITCEAAFPGGKEKFAEFLKFKLSTPEDLEPGQKQKVLVRFKVDVDGSISNIEVLETGGIRFDNEVIRVLKKMPKWSPAMQNGIKVSSYFIQVVTFIGEEQ